MLLDIVFVTPTGVFDVKIIWKNILEPDWPQIAVWRMHIACWITKATNTNSEYVILISFPLQQRLHERA